MNEKKASPVMVGLYLFIAVTVLYIAAAVGSAFDKSTSGGVIAWTQIVTELSTIVYQPDYILLKVVDTSSAAFKFAGISAVIGIFVVLYYSTKKTKTRPGEEHGSARYGTVSEAKKLADKKIKPETRNTGAVIDNNIIFSQNVKMSLNTRQHRENLNVLVIGGSGSGKSLFFAKPNIQQMNTSIVVTDPKGELLRTQGKMLEENGYEVKVFNLIEMANSFHYNPFAYVYKDVRMGRKGKNGKEIIEKQVDETAVVKMVEVFLTNTKEKNSGGDKFWEDSTKALLTALAFYLLEMAEEHANWAAVTELLKMAEVKEDDEEFQSELDELFTALKELNPDSLAISFYKAFKQAAGETAKSILISCAIRLQAFNIPAIANLTHKDTLDLGTLGDKKTALFVIIPAADKTYNFLAAMLYTQMFSKLYDAANFKHGGRLPIHVRCILDEFANVGQIPDFDQLIATMRSMEISANVIIQNIAQLKALYKDTWEVISGNCDTFLFLGGKEEATLKMISGLLGKETITHKAYNQSKGRSASTSINNSIIGRELMTPDELAVMPDEKCLLFVRSHHPYYDKKYDTFHHVNFKFTGDADIKNEYDVYTVKTEKMENIVFAVPDMSLFTADVDEDAPTLPPQSDLFSEAQEAPATPAKPENNTSNEQKGIMDNMSGFIFDNGDDDVEVVNTSPEQMGVPESDIVRCKLETSPEFNPVPLAKEAIGGFIANSEPFGVNAKTYVPSPSELLGEPNDWTD